MILPSRRQLWGWGAVTAAVALCYFAGLPLFYGWVLIALWLALAGGSILLLWRENILFRICRQCGSVQQSGQRFTVRIFLESTTRRPLALQVFDHYPSAAVCHSLPLTATLKPQETLELAYSLTFIERGRFHFGWVQLRYPDRSGLWLADRYGEEETSVRVYPRFDHDKGGTLTGICTPQPGHVRPLHDRNGNGDFAQLRDYLSGDSISRIDHKASARHRKWLVRDYEYEHQQPVILMLDASRRQQARYRGKAVFDELLNAATRLARAALQAGDETGLQVFSGSVQAWLPASRGSGQYRRIVETIFDRHADRQVPDYTAALLDVYRRQRQRALIILLTTLEAGDEKLLHPVWPLLQQRHHLMLVNLRPPWLENREAAHAGQNFAEAALGESARMLYGAEFAALQTRLRREKLIFVPARADSLCVQLLNAYMAYKNHLRK